MASELRVCKSTGGRVTASAKGKQDKQLFCENAKFLYYKFVSGSCTSYVTLMNVVTGIKVGGMEEVQKKVYKPVERLIKSIEEISEIIDAFESEEVQLRIVEAILPFVGMGNRQNGSPFNTHKSTDAYGQIPGKGPARKKFGLKREMDQIMLTDFFCSEKTIAEVIQQVNTDGKCFKPSQLSGILLGLVKNDTLKRHRSPLHNRYVYFKP